MSAKKKLPIAEAVETVVKPIEVATGPSVQKQSKPSWEVKDRFYYLLGKKEPLTLRIKTSGLFWFDEEKGYEREILYTRNQKTIFVDEMQGEKRLANIVFSSGGLLVPKNMQTLQKMLSKYHPYKGVIYAERDEVEEAKDDLEFLNLEVDAMNAARSLDIDTAEAVMRTEIGSKVSEMSSKELKRDLLMFARRNPVLFLDLMDDDNVLLRNIGIKATETGIITLSSDNRTFSWGSNNRKLMTVPFDEHPYSALASWFKTDEGMEVLNSIEKRLN